MYNTMYGSNFGGRFLKMLTKLKNTCIFGIFLCQNILSSEFDSVFHGLESLEYGCCCFLWPGYGIKIQNEP